MNKTPNKLTFGTVNSMYLHRQQLERKIDSIRAELAGRSQPLLPKNWNDEDALRLARELSSLMVQVYNLKMTEFDENNPYPENDTPIEEIRYYNPYFQNENPFQPPDLPQALWTEVLHCGILIAAGDFSFCFPSSGTFGDLEEFFLGTVRSGAGPVLQYRYIMDQIESAFADGQLSGFPCASELCASIQALQSDGNDRKMQSFVEYYIGSADLLQLAVDLYLYQRGVGGMLENRYYAVYALLNGVQKELKALEAEAAEQGAAQTGWDLNFDPDMEEEEG